jgi:broad specificity phosphatase PhoE
MPLYLVRHGETDWNRDGRAQGREDMPLNLHGMAQAEALAERFRDVTVAAVYSSPAQRAFATAAAIADPHDITINPRDALLEMDLGQLDGVKLGAMRDRFPDFFTNWMTDAGTARFPGGETLEETQGRAWEAIMQIVQDHPPEAAVVVVSHAFATYSILCRALGMPLSNYGRLRQDPAAISTLNWRLRPGGDPASGNFVLLASNQTHHLDDIVEPAASPS